MIKFSFKLLILFDDLRSSGSLIGIRSQDDQPPTSERSSGDGGSVNDGQPDDGGCATEEIYATISRRQRHQTSYGHSSNLRLTIKTHESANI